MNTSTETKPATSSSKKSPRKQPSRPKRELVVRHLEEVVRWVEIRVRTTSAIAKKLNSKPPLVRHNYGRDLYGAVFAAKSELEETGRGSHCEHLIELATMWRSLRGFKAAPFTFLIPRDQWEAVLKVAAALEIEAEHLIRAALHDRYCGLIAAEKRPPIGAEERPNLVVPRI